jgi:hypothetical protein
MSTSAIQTLFDREEIFSVRLCAALKMRVFFQNASAH